MITAIYVPDIISGLVAKAALTLGRDIAFDKGHYIQVVRNQTEKEANPNKPNKYPLFWLVMDIKETMNPRLGVYADVEVQVVIATDTLAEYTMDERVANSFIPVLYPIYEAFMQQVSACPFLNNSLPANNRHEKYDRYYWGTNDGNGNGSANLFNDKVDAIQIKGLVLQVKKNYCQTLSI